LPQGRTNTTQKCMLCIIVHFWIVFGYGQYDFNQNKIWIRHGYHFSKTRKDQIEKHSIRSYLIGRKFWQAVSDDVVATSSPKLVCDLLSSQSSIENVITRRNGGGANCTLVDPSYRRPEIVRQLLISKLDSFGLPDFHVCGWVTVDVVRLWGCISGRDFRLRKAVRFKVCIDSWLYGSSQAHFLRSKSWWQDGAGEV